MKSKDQNDLLLSSFPYFVDNKYNIFHSKDIFRPSISLGGTWDEVSEYNCPHCHARIDNPKELDFCFGCLSWVEKKNMDHFHYRVTLTKIGENE